MKYIKHIILILLLCFGILCADVQMVEGDGLTCTSSGIAYIPSTDAYGEWEFDYYFTGNYNYISFMSPINNTVESVGSYYGWSPSPNGTIRFRKVANNPISTASGYLTLNTRYRIKITRSIAGVFTFYIQGGVYGWDGWTTSLTTTDVEYTNSSYFVVELTTNSAISNLKINGELKHISEATVVAPAAFTKTGTVVENININTGASGDMKIN